MFEQCLYFNLNELARKVNRVWDNAFDEVGLSPAHAYLLRLVLEKPGISQKEIVSELKLEKSTVSRFVDALIKKKLLVRSKSGRDSTILPTEQAKMLEVKLHNKADELYTRIGTQIGDDNLERLVRVLRATSQKLE